MATATRGVQTIHGATANINGVDGGGLMQATINTGYDQVINATHDGLMFPMPERLLPFVRGTIDCQDIGQAIDVFNGTAGDYTFYEKETKLATYAKHVLSTVYIHNMTISIINNDYSGVSFEYECKPGAGEDMSDMWATTINQAKPAYLASERLVRVTSATHTALINHVTGITINMTGNLLREATDGALGYEDMEIVNYAVSGSITFKDTTVAASIEQLNGLMERAKADLVIVCPLSAGGGNKTITAKNVIFTGGSSNKSESSDYNIQTANFICTDNTGTPLTTATALTIV